MISMRDRGLTSIADLSGDELATVLNAAAYLKRHPAQVCQLASGENTGHAVRKTFTAHTRHL